MMEECKWEINNPSVKLYGKVYWMTPLCIEGDIKEYGVSTNKKSLGFIFCPYCGKKINFIDKVNE